MRKALLQALMAGILVGAGVAHAQAASKPATGAGSKSAPAATKAGVQSPAQPATAQTVLKAPSSNELLKSALAVFRDSIDQKQPMLVAGNTVYIDREDLDARLGALGFVSDYPKGGQTLNGRPLPSKSWNAVKICRGTGAVENCTLPPRTVVLRFFNARWTVENTELMLVMGAFRRAEKDADAPSLGGAVTTLVFTRRGNQWMLAKVAKVERS